MNLTNEERQIAIDQLTCVDCCRSTYRVVPIPPERHGEPDRWVAVEPLSKYIQANIRQPDPEKAVLCASVNRCGFVEYFYGDKISCYIISSIILTVIFSVISTPLLLLCCVPMIRKLIKVKF
jgi:hypothetical protein